MKSEWNFTKHLYTFPVVLLSFRMDFFFAVDLSFGREKLHPFLDVLYRRVTISHWNALSNVTIETAVIFQSASLLTGPKRQKKKPVNSLGWVFNEKSLSAPDLPRCDLFAYNTLKRRLIKTDELCKFKKGTSVSPQQP